MLQCNYSFVNFHAFVNTGHTVFTLQFYWRVQMLNSPSHFALLRVNKPGKDSNASELAGFFPLLSFLVVLAEAESLAETHKHRLEDEEKRTFNGKKLTELLCALVLLWVNQELKYVVWSTMTERSSANKPCRVWQRQQMRSKDTVAISSEATTVSSNTGSAFFVQPRKQSCALESSPSPRGSSPAPSFGVCG